MQPLVAMIVYAIVPLAISFLNMKFVMLRPIKTRKTLILYENGTLFKENFKKAKIDLNEFLSQARTKGFFNLSDVKIALLEENGKISFMPYSKKRPANPEDLGLNPGEDDLATNLILDGKVMYKNLQELGFDILWLNEELQKQGIIKIDNIFLATYSKDGNLSVYITN